MLSHKNIKSQHAQLINILKTNKIQTQMSTPSSNFNNTNQNSSSSRRNCRRRNQRHSAIVSEAYHPTISKEEQNESKLLISSGNTSLEGSVEMLSRNEETSCTRHPSEESRANKPTKSEGKRKPSNEVERLSTVTSIQSSYI